MLCPLGYTDVSYTKIFAFCSHCVAICEAQSNLVFQKFAGMTGALFIAAGVIGAAVAGVIVDKSKKFEEVAKIGVSFMALAAIVFALVGS